MRSPKHKGIGLLPVVQALNADPRAQAHVPDDLRHYLTAKLLPSAWYAEADYERLLQALASGIGRAKLGSDAWTYFGRAAARRDIAGSQEDVPARSRTEISGTYRNLLFPPGDVAGLFYRISKIWRLYHDSGQVSIARHAESSATVVVQLHDFSFSSRGLVDLQTGYMTEFARIGGIVMRGELARCALGSASLTEWNYHVEARSEHLLSIASIASGHQRNSLPTACI